MVKIVKYLQTHNCLVLYVTGSKINQVESDLLTLLQSKNAKGFEILYDDYGDALYGVILKIVKVEEVAQDVLQDSFVKIWKNIQAYSREKGTLFTWILNIARNTAIDKIRSQAYKQTYQNTSIQYKVVDLQLNTEQSVETIGLQGMVGQLAPEYQQIIDYLYFRGYTQSEAAEALDLPLGTVKTRVKTALRELRKLSGIES